MSENLDEHLHPVATGAAAKTVKTHEAPEALVFYAGWFCPFAQRVWIALEERGIPYQYKEVDPYKKEEEYLKINPKGLVPALIYKGKPLYESLVLLEFLEDAFPPSTTHPSIHATDPYDRALERLWLDHISKNVIPAFFRLLMLSGAAATAAEPEARQQAEATARDEFVGALAALAAQRKGPYFLGEYFGFVDVALAPFVLRDYILVEHRGFKPQEVPHNYAEWADLLRTRGSVVRTTSEKQHYDTLFNRYLTNTVQSEAAKAIRAGKAIP